MATSDSPSEGAIQRKVDAALAGLAADLFGPEFVENVLALSTDADLDWPSFLALDDTLGGPSVRRVSTHRHGNYFLVDRDVFRPLQYCDMHLQPDTGGHTRLSLMRIVVHMAGLHLEVLLKRIAIVPRRPLGACLHHPLVKARVPEELRSQIGVLAGLYNIAKHDVSHEKDTHRFSLEDALLAYFCARKLAMPLYSMARVGSESVWRDE